jgi:hypothetical protein
MKIRKVAVVIGVLFIIATVVNVAGTNLIGSALSAANMGILKIGSLFQFISALCSVGIAVWLYPILKKYNPYLALTAVIFRTIEAVFYILSALLSLSLTTIGQGLLTDTTIQNYILTVRDISGFVYAVLAFIAAGIAYYVIFYQTKLVPRWLSVWGILSCLTLLIAVLSAIYHGPAFTISGPMMILAAPIALQEMVLAIWLIVKGFNSSASFKSR